jgi:transcriptional regulator with XRE-family HTH domain
MKPFIFGETDNKMVKHEFNGVEFSRRVRMKRAELDIDMRGLAKKIGVSPATLSRLEGGKTPDINTFANVSYWMGASLNDFFVPKTIKKKTTKK